MSRFLWLLRREVWEHKAIWVAPVIVIGSLLLLVLTGNVHLGPVTAEGGVFHLAMKEGDGARFSTHGNVGAPRHFTFWREGSLRAVLEEAGWSVTRVDRATSPRGEEWLDLLARRRSTEGR